MADMPATAETRRMSTGTYEDAKKLIGRKGEKRQFDEEINRSMIRFYASVVEDGNPVYWDEAEAGKRFGGIVSPPGMIPMVWGMRVPWEPKARGEAQGIDIPLPGSTVINVATETEYFRPVKIGDKLSSQDEVADISPEKKTRLGVGHFITTIQTVSNQRGEVVAKHKNTLLRFTPNS